MTRVLIIDDCNEFKLVVQEILEDIGYYVFSADGPKEALNICDQQEFDVVLCDLVMSTEEEKIDDYQNHSAMVGVHTMRELARRHPNLPIIAVSGQLTGAPLHSMQSFGAVKCLSKPFGRDELIGAIDTVTGQGSIIEPSID